MKFLKGFVRRFATAFSILSILLVGGTWAATQFLTGTVRRYFGRDRSS